MSICSASCKSGKESRNFLVELGEILLVRLVWGRSQFAGHFRDGIFGLVRTSLHRSLVGVQLRPQRGLAALLASDQRNREVGTISVRPGCSPVGQTWKRQSRSSLRRQSLLVCCLPVGNAFARSTTLPWESSSLSSSSRSAVTETCGKGPHGNSLQGCGERLFGIQACRLVPDFFLDKKRSFRPDVTRLYPTFRGNLGCEESSQKDSLPTAHVLRKRRPFSPL